MKFAHQLDAADFATEEAPQEDDENPTEEEETDSVCIQCDDGGMLMSVQGAPRAQLLRSFCSALSALHTPVLPAAA